MLYRRSREQFYLSPILLVLLFRDVQYKNVSKQQLKHTSAHLWLYRIVSGDIISMNRRLQNVWIFENEHRSVPSNIKRSQARSVVKSCWDSTRNVNSKRRIPDTAIRYSAEIRLWKHDRSDYFWCRSLVCVLCKHHLQTRLVTWKRFCSASFTFIS